VNFVVVYLPFRRICWTPLLPSRLPPLPEVLATVQVRAQVLHRPDSPPRNLVQIHRPRHQVFRVEVLQLSLPFSPLAHQVRGHPKSQPPALLSPRARPQPLRLYLLLLPSPLGNLPAGPLLSLPMSRAGRRQRFHQRHRQVPRRALRPCLHAFLLGSQARCPRRLPAHLHPKPQCLYLL